MSNESAVTNLLNGVEFSDPRMYDLLQLLINDTYATFNELFPPTTQSTFGVTGQPTAPLDPTGFSFTIFPDNLRLMWSDAGAGITYELRYKAGVALPTDWGTASFILKTGTLAADINPVTVPLTTGAHSFLLKTIDTNNNYSDNAVVLSFSVAQIPAPVITPSVLGNNVLLYWTTPTSTWKIDHYNVYKGGVLQGQMTGTFEAIFELVGGSYSYTVTAVDIAGNVGTPSTAAVVQVSDPPDFVFLSGLTSTFTGTKTNCKIDIVAGLANKLLVDIDTTKTFQHHFDDNVWASPQDQVNAGYPIFIEPAKTTGSYQEVFDFGSIVNNVVVVLSWNLAAINNTVAVSTSTIEISTDNITYGSPITGFAAFASAVRYVRFTMNFVGSDDKSLAYISNLQCLLNVRNIIDSGSGSAVSTDAGGTTFTYNKTFLAAPLVTATPVSTTPASAIVTSITASSFKVLVYDDTGTRVTKTVNWVARGIAQ